MLPKANVLLTAVALLLSATLAAQVEDTAFVNNYIRFRSLVDPLPRYSIYMMTPQKKVLQLNEAQSTFGEAYHFLRQKEVNPKQSNFIVGILIKGLETDYPVGKLDEITNRYFFYKILTTYRLSFEILVHTAKGEELQFPLCTTREFVKETKVKMRKAFHNGYQAMDVDQNIYQVIADQRPNLDPNADDYKRLFLSILQEYKNYYVDRVDQ
jgi:hypothetical protein